MPRLALPLFDFPIYFYHMVMVYLSLGTNVGDRERNMALLKKMVFRFLGKPHKASRLMKTEPVGVLARQRWFYNCIISGAYSGSPSQLLAECLSVESKLGRVRTSVRFSPRTADVDILTYGNKSINRKSLQIPHPQIRARRFCIEGLRDIAPNALLPGTKKSYSYFFENMPERVQRQKVLILG
jgi:2-amino-4-hydroxy-6-hydroxymethyldihydropteridine diphosphokinase